MAKVIIDLTMSLDGFIAGPNDGSKYPLGERGGEHIFDWFTTGDKPAHGSDLFKPEGNNVKVIDEMVDTTGAMLTGRRTYDITKGWGGSHPFKGLPIVTLSHSVPDQIPQGDSRITFVTDGVEGAVAQAKAAAGDKDVGIGGASIAQQALRAGLVDEIYLHIAPYILGDGVRLFDNIGDHGIQLEHISTVDGPKATHLRYRVVRSSGTEPQ
jgi:dihydrofolate reductase